MRTRLCVVVVLLVPTFAMGASREIVELQRDVATLQDQVRALSNSNAEKLTAVTVLLQQTLDATNSTNKAVAVLESRMNTQLDKQGQGVGQSVAVLGAKVDQMSSDYQSMRDTLNAFSGATSRTCVLPRGSPSGIRATRAALNSSRLSIRSPVPLKWKWISGLRPRRQWSG